MRKRATAAIVSASATLLLATSAMAGGWANAVMDEPPNQPGGPGEPVTIGFTLLQHGVTPVDWGTPQIVLTNDATGQSVSFDARPRGADGHWVAEISVPAEGTWGYQVRHELEIAMSGFQPITVGEVAATTSTTSAGAATSLALQPALLVVGAFLAVLAMGSVAVGVIAYRRTRLDRARA
jgi:hypothetical protein